MTRFSIPLLTLLFLIVTATKLFALGADDSESQRAAAGPHCVHGFFVNEQDFIFYAGDTARLNDDFKRLLAGTYETRRVILHVGTKRAWSPWDKQPRDMPTDWMVSTIDDPDDAAKAVPRRILQVDVWLGSSINLSKLKIPAEFEVRSGGEIEAFLKDRK